MPLEASLWLRKSQKVYSSHKGEQWQISGDKTFGGGNRQEKSRGLCIPGPNPGLEGEEGHGRQPRRSCQSQQGCQGDFHLVKKKKGEAHRIVQGLHTQHHSSLFGDP